MNQLSFRQVVVLVCDCLVLAIGIAHIPKVMERAQVPITVEERTDGVFIVGVHEAAVSSGLESGDRILRCADLRIEIAEALEHIGDLHRIGDDVTLEAERSGSTITTQIRLIPFYDSPRFPLVMAFVGLSICALAALIAWQSLRTVQASLLHWSLLGLGLSILLTQGRVDPTTWNGLIERGALYFSYMLATAGFFLFAYSFPTLRFSHPRLTFGLVLLVSAAMALAVVQSYVVLAEQRTPEAVQQFHRFYDYFHVVQAVLAAGMIVGILYSYRKAETADDRRRIQWIIWGLAVGPLPFLLLIIVPNIVLSKDLIPEDLATVFLLVTPFSLAVSLLRHQLFDIEILINRSIVYGLLTVFIGTVYAVSVLIVASVVGGNLPFGEFSLAVIVSMGIALAINPIRLRLQHVVDRTLFPVRTDYRNAVRRTMRDLHAALSTEELCGVLCREIQLALPTNGVEVFVRDEGRFKLMHSLGNASGEQAILLDDDNSEEGLSTGTGTWHIMTLRTEAGALLGALRLSFRNPAERLSTDEEDFLHTIRDEAAMTMERLELQRSVIFESEERRRLQELNSLKSYFVSSVSHELRTPLTSIRMFAEMLRTGMVPQEKKRREYLEVINHEAERLSRMIDNVLDFSRIERGVKEYRMGTMDLVKIIRQAASAMAYPFAVSSARLRISGPRKLPQIIGDGDALQAVIINLLSNALKYSRSVKDVQLAYGRAGKRLFVRVKDKGMGIAKEQLDHVFERFYRIQNEHTAQVGGMGLGLSIVKHVVDAHGGEITVESTVGKGTTFTVFIPYTDNHRRAHEADADR